MNLDKNLDCKACSENQKRDRGCVEDSPIPGRWQTGEYKFQRCPIKEVGNDVFWFIKAYNFMEKGILPRGRWLDQYGYWHSEGWLDQSNKFIEAMGFITKEMNDGRERHKN